MRRLSFFALSVLLLIVVARSGSRADAGVILVPGPYNGATQILQLAPMGESFTAEDPYIRSVGFSVEDINPAPADHSLTISLYADGLNLFLGGGTDSDLTPGFAGFAEVTFPTPIGPLTVGDTYTALITDTTSRWGVATTDSPDAYPAGEPVFKGVPQNDADLALRVTPAAVPLPDAAKLAATGALILVALGWRRRRRA